MFDELGGYHADYDRSDAYDNWIHRKEIIWPDFKENQIEVKQFIGGTHFYAYIDDVQVRDRDTLKWDTYEEAYNQAKQWLEVKTI